MCIKAHSKSCKRIILLSKNILVKQIFRIVFKLAFKKYIYILKINLTQQDSQLLYLKNLVFKRIKC